MNLPAGQIISFEPLRINATFAPSYLVIKNFWLAVGVNYSEFADNTYNYYVFVPSGSLGIGFNLGKHGFLRDLTPYVGFGLGEGLFGINSQNSANNNNNATYNNLTKIQTTGLEYAVTKVLVFI